MQGFRQENFRGHVELSQEISDTDFPARLKTLPRPAHACLQVSHSYFCHGSLPLGIWNVRNYNCHCKGCTGPLTSPAQGGGDLLPTWLCPSHDSHRLVTISFSMCSVSVSSAPQNLGYLLLKMGEQVWVLCPFLLPTDSSVTSSESF